MQSYPISLDIKEIKQMRKDHFARKYNFIPRVTTEIKKPDNTKCKQRCRTVILRCCCWENNTMSVGILQNWWFLTNFHIKLNIHLSYDFSVFTQEKEIHMSIKTFMRTFIFFVYKNPDMKKIQMSFKEVISKS